MENNIPVEEAGNLLLQGAKFAIDPRGPDEIPVLNDKEIESAKSRIDK